MITEQIRKTAEELFPYVVESRRRLHRRPELSGKEYETAAFIVEEMKKLGLEPTWLWESEMKKREAERLITTAGLIWMRMRFYMEQC